MSELLIKIADSNTFFDGDVLAVKPNGHRIMPVGMTNWIDSDIVPPALPTFPKYIRLQVRRRILKLKWILDHTAAEVAAEYGIAEATATLDKANFLADSVSLKTYGYDTNWGWDTLKRHFALRMDGLSKDEMCGELADLRRADDHHGAPLAKRRWRVEYEDVYAPPKLANIRNVETYVAIDRDTAISQTYLVATDV